MAQPSTFQVWRQILYRRRILSRIHVCYLRTSARCAASQFVQLDNTDSHIVNDVTAAEPSVPSSSMIGRFVFVSPNYALSGSERTSLQNNVIVMSDFVSVDEEQQLLNEVEGAFKRLRYQKDHWDDAIHLYRETERQEWSEPNGAIIARLRRAAFPPDVQHIGHVHVLDVAKDGFIRPHIDSVRYCGDVIGGISLLSDSVMRLRHKDIEHFIVDMLLPRRSLYILRGIGRYQFKHEILKNAESYFMDKYVAKDRRVSVICRSEPLPASN